MTKITKKKKEIEMVAVADSNNQEITTLPTMYWKIPNKPVMLKVVYGKLKSIFFNHSNVAHKIMRIEILFLDSGYFIYCGLWVYALLV